MKKLILAAIIAGTTTQAFATSGQLTGSHTVNSQCGITIDDTDMGMGFNWHTGSGTLPTDNNTAVISLKSNYNAEFMVKLSNTVWENTGAVIGYDNPYLKGGNSGSSSTPYSWIMNGKPINQEGMGDNWDRYGANINEKQVPNITNRGGRLELFPGFESEFSNMSAGTMSVTTTVTLSCVNQ